MKASRQPERSSVRPTAGVAWRQTYPARAMTDILKGESDMTFPRPSLAPAALVLALGAWLAGCSGAPRADTASAATTSADTVSSQGGTTVSCKQLTKEQVQPLIVYPITDIKVTAAGTDGEGQQCIFDGNNGDGAIDVLVLGGTDGPPAYASAIKAELHGPVDVPGVGDKASRETGDGEINSIKGNLYCSVSLSSNGDVPGIGKLEQAAGGTTHIAERAYAAEAAALGTLCNRIYGSGNTTPDLRLLTGAPGPTR